MTSAPPQDARAIPAAIHLVEHRQQSDRIDVEHRLGAAVVAGCGVVAAEGQDVVETFAGELPGFAFEAVAVKILAREMNQNFLAAVEDRLAEGHRAKLRIAAGVVGDRNPVDPIAVHQMRGKRAARIACASAIVPRVVTNSTPIAKLDGFDSLSLSVYTISNYPFSMSTPASEPPVVAASTSAGTGYNSLNNSTARVASGPYPSAPISSANV